MFIALRVVLQFIDRRHRISEHLHARRQCVTVLHSVNIATYILKTDILLLATSLKIFATVALRVMGSISRIIILSGFTWEAMLKQMDEI